MFSLNDLLDHVECQGPVRVLMIGENGGNIRLVFSGKDLRQVPYSIGCKELVYIYTNHDVTVYEVQE